MQDPKSLFLQEGLGVFNFIDPLKGVSSYWRLPPSRQQGIS